MRVRPTPSGHEPGGGFIPARPKRAFIRFLEQVNRLVALPWLRIDVEIPADDLDRLRGLPADSGLMLASNHPSFSDPMVLFEVTRRWGRICTWMAAREIFNRFGGWMGTFIRRTGAFSVFRGGSNQVAEQFACRLLREHRFPIIIFPEGHNFYLNDVILPLKPGVASWSVDAVSDSAGLQVLVIPIAIKYRYLEDIREGLDRVVTQMEQQVLRRAGGVPPGAFWSRLYVRLHRLADVVLTRQERRRHHTPPHGADPEERAHLLCAEILRRLEQCHLDREQAGDFFDRARQLMALLKDDDEPGHQRDALDARFAWALSTFHQGYLSPDSSPERFAETVMKLQRELTGRVPLSFRAWRRAHVRVGAPIEVNRFLPVEQGNDAATRGRATSAILAELADALKTQLLRAHPPA